MEVAFGPPATYHGRTDPKNHGFSPQGAKNGHGGTTGNLINWAVKKTFIDMPSSGKCGKVWGVLNPKRGHSYKMGQGFGNLYGEISFFWGRGTKPGPLGFRELC